MSIPAFHTLCRRVFLVGAHFPERSEEQSTVTPPEGLGRVIDAFRARRSVAEVSASKYGNLYRSAYWAIYLLSSFAVGMALLTMALPSFGGWFVALETLTIFVILTVFTLGSKQRWHAQWLAFRREAEVLRYLPIVHIVHQLSLESIQRQGSNPQSTQPVLVESPYEVPIDISTEEKEHLATLDQLITSSGVLNQELRQWVRLILQGQIRYHERRAFEEHLIHERVHKLAFFCFVVTAFAVLAHAGFHTIWLSVVAAFFPSLAAALTGVAAHAEMVRLRLESESVVKDLAEIERRLADPTSSNEMVKDCLKAFVGRVLGEVIVWHTFAKHKALTLA